VIKEDPTLAGDIRVLAIAVADNQKRIDGYKAEFKVPFPIFPDEKGEIYMALKQPNVPSLLLATGDGRVLMYHKGLIEDFDKLVKEIREASKTK
jgi:hypothetical protein